MPHAQTAFGKPLISCLHEHRIDCAGILKLRNSDIELRKGETDIGRKNTRVRMVFRVHINQATGRTVSLQVASNPIECCEYISYVSLRGPQSLLNKASVFRLVNPDLQTTSMGVGTPDGLQRIYNMCYDMINGMHESTNFIFCTATLIQSSNLYFCVHAAGSSFSTFVSHSG